MTEKIAIAFDAMGGDFAPRQIVKGAVQASKDLGIKAYLVGNKEAISEVLFKSKVKLSDPQYDLEIVEADEEIDMGEKNPAYTDPQWAANSRSLSRPV